MGNHKLSKYEKHLHAHISEIMLMELSNKTAATGTVTSVVMNNDYTSAVVFVTFPKNANEAIQELNSAKGFIKSQLARKVEMRKVPELEFKIDTLLEDINKLETLIDKVN
ncbi:MAG: 30S ribosome-binding factor RbfA [Tenericutes bacterium]|nr:MAG: 30S ribosome-binding factor RbfA [Mycoplasmatota bacterium]